MNSIEYHNKRYVFSIYIITGKLMENVRKYRDVRFITNLQQHERYISKPQFKKFLIIDDGLVCVELKQARVTLNKPIYAGKLTLL